MNYNLTKPCSNCPFRCDKHFELNPNRVEEIVYQANDFACHKTVKYDDDGRVVGKSESCAGLMIMLEKMKQPNQMMRIAERLGYYDRAKLDMDAPVYDHVDDYLDKLG